MTNTTPSQKNFWQKIEEEHPGEFIRFQEWLLFVIEHSGCDATLFKLIEMDTPIALVWGMALNFFDDLAITIHMEYLPRERHFIGLISKKRLLESFYGLHRDAAQRATLIGAFKIFAERK